MAPRLDVSRNTVAVAYEQLTADGAERRGAVVIEDDYDSEFRFDGRPLDPLQSLDRTGR